MYCRRNLKMLIIYLCAQEMVKFSRYIVAKFFEMLPKNPVLLAELVVWKYAGDCYEIVEGYGSLALRYEITHCKHRNITRSLSPFVFSVLSLAPKDRVKIRIMLTLHFVTYQTITFVFALVFGLSHNVASTLFI